MKYDLIEAKKRLYALLLDVAPDDYSDAEVNIMYELSKDEDIQKHLRDKISKNGEH
jgi:hypothetical protein